MAEEFRRREGEPVYSEQIEEVALQAAETAEFQKAVEQASSRIEAIKDVRVLLRQHFPQILELPEPQIIPEKEGIMPPASNEFKIAKNIVDLLYEKDKKQIK